MQDPAAAHAFSTFVRAVARGETLSRPLTEAEAETAMAQVLTGKVEPVQLGA
ncbi:MAG: glycosyl transferase, partial [Alphaproteobacteria bacterium]|nr:glycosyl transferase [Alphaproteobacteria bacterium]